jgi:hypothetical protein
MIEFSKYSKVKDRYCLCYFGSSDEYLVLLKILKKPIERHFPGLRLSFGCRDDKAHLLGVDSDVMKISEIKVRRNDFAHIRELMFNGATHPVEDLIKENGIADCVVNAEIKEPLTKKCVIITKGNYPTKGLERMQVDQLKKLAMESGFYVELDSDINNAGLVMGVESVWLFEAASRGIRTKLVPTGIGLRLYKMMFPHSEVAA